MARHRAIVARGRRGRPAEPLRLGGSAPAPDRGANAALAHHTGQPAERTCHDVTDQAPATPTTREREVLRAGNVSEPIADALGVGVRTLTQLVDRLPSATLLL